MIFLIEGNPTQYTLTVTISFCESKNGDFATTTTKKNVGKEDIYLSVSTPVRRKCSTCHQVPGQTL